MTLLRIIFYGYAALVAIVGLVLMFVATWGAIERRRRAAARRKRKGITA